MRKPPAERSADNNTPDDDILLLTPGHLAVFCCDSLFASVQVTPLLFFDRLCLPFQDDWESKTLSVAVRFIHISISVEGISYQCFL
jgi:hypothetical protein